MAAANLQQQQQLRWWVCSFCTWENSRVDSKTCQVRGCEGWMCAKCKAAESCEECGSQPYCAAHVEKKSWYHGCSECQRVLCRLCWEETEEVYGPQLSTKTPLCTQCHEFRAQCDEKEAARAAAADAVF